MTETPITGGCLCGAVRYEADGPPFQVGHCHCRMCRKGGGGLFGTFAFFKHKHFRFVAEEPSRYASSDMAKRAFCAHCGSPIAYQHRDAGYIGIWLGTFDKPEEHEPRAHWYSESKIAWVDIHADLPDATTDLVSYRSQSASRA